MQTERQPVILQHGKRDRGNAEQGRVGGARRIARRFETERRSRGRGEADAGVALRRQLGVERTGLVALREVVPVVVEAHGLGLGEASEHGARGRY